MSYGAVLGDDSAVSSIDVARDIVIPFFFFFQAEDGIRDVAVTGVQTCALPIYPLRGRSERHPPTGIVGDGDAALGRGALFLRAGRHGQREQAHEVGAMCPAAHSKKPTPDGSGDGLASAPGAQRHHPSREGSTGGANGEVSWLRALGSPSRWCPSGDEPRAQRAAPLHARYSGGAAPDSHRLP